MKGNPMKETARVVVVLLCASLWTSAFAQPAESFSSPESLSMEWAADWSAKKLEAVMTLYAPEPVFLPTVGPRWEGTGVIRKNFASLLAKYNPHVVLHSIKTGSSGDLAYDSGIYKESITPIKRGNPIVTEGAYLFLFQRLQDGNWKILEQTWTDFEQPPRL